jgi:UDP-N-acetylmuramate: L-alanyl-gamma-D-glutamyl-meso-diaminopimelate ligase
MWNSLRFCRKNYRGGILVYNEDDAEVKRVSEAATNPTRRLYYSNYKVDNGTTLLETPEGDMPIEVF